MASKAPRLKPRPHINNTSLNPNTKELVVSYVNSDICYRLIQQRGLEGVKISVFTNVVGL